MAIYIEPHHVVEVLMLLATIITGVRYRRN